ncbi:RGM domain family member B [Poeciliopsis prolifica]|uniref:RGM domain family member B n=1 Tax=Poeciliopsis prolifica TaxID=188132 RepID=UPI002413159B|nr:RGM domain family member B [Poeciliopsis prolifica]
MGRAGCCYRGAERLASPSAARRFRPLLLLIVGLCCGAHLGQCQVATPQCRIQKCTTDFVSLTSHLTPAVDGFDTEFCKALRAYSACTQRTAKACRGNLVFHSALLGISDLMSQRSCSRDGPTPSAHPEILLEPCNYHSRTQHTHTHSHSHTHSHGHGHSRSRPGYLFCGLFGDPHLRTFKDSFQTCKVEGAWPLIDNDYLSVQVTNVPVVPGSSATATNKITIIFKPYEGCTDQRVYQAVTDSLPAAFDDGTVSSGDPIHTSFGADGVAGKVRALWISERSPGRHVELHAGYIGVTVIIRQLGRYLTLAVRIPEELAQAYDDTQDLQLCLNGCPSSERIDQAGHLPLPLSPPAFGLQQQQLHRPSYASQTQAYPHGATHVFALDGAKERCSEQLEVLDIYFHSCVFDLLTTGDANFTLAAHSAQKDMESLHPHRDRWRIYPRGSAASYFHSDSQLIKKLALLLLCALSIVFM